MNVFVFTPRYPPQGGGSAIYFSNLVNELSEDHRFIILTFTSPSEPIKETMETATIYRVIPRYKSLPSVFRLLIESTISFLFSLLLLRKYSVAHVHASSYATPGVAMGTFLTRKPVLYDCRDELFSPRLVQFGRTPYWFSCASNVDAILTAHGIPEERIVRVPVVNPPYIEEQYAKQSDEDPNDRFEMIFVGRLIEDKGVPLLIETFESFVKDHPNSYLTLVGDDPTGDVDELLDQKNLDGELIATGELEHVDVIQQIATADVLVLPSRDEAMPRVIVEAFALGVPVIATKVGAIPELIDDGENGILIDHSPESLYAALSCLYESPQLVNEMSNSAKEKSEEWSWETVNERVDRTYRALD